ncbi:GNAT family N-acetyltransferase [Nocardiopsis metallicus]|uniref:RimJ/RimL family protein N-acetyltransferase n=1 Tax=Nocardiopsis metallicus TaxID=179819 RepID=A0A840W9E3_9ACTN|nr:GNAT family protein [Nocardiopsis metallicus]MBB5493629.1 RimJ/RimL family protein N-acetyltransferase [Nocardiopsis metallicus]
MNGTVELTALHAENDREQLVAFLTGNSFPFHLDSSPTELSVRRRMERGDFSAPDNEGYWVLEGGERVGLVVLSDVEDPCALLDLRLRESSRGLGLGLHTLLAIGDRAFSTHSHLRRLEGSTRDDNVAMQRTFLKAGWVKESHYREAGPEIDGVHHDILGYSLTRGDWKTGESHPPNWALGLSLR